MKRTKKRIPIPDKAIMTHDPSLTGWGWSIVNTKGEVVASDMIETKSMNKVNRTRKGDDNVRRAEEIAHVIYGAMKKYNVIYVVSELPHGSQNSQGAMMIGMVIGMLVSFSVSMDIGTEWFSENDSKKAVLGKGSASKDEMIQAIKKLYPNMVWKKTKKWSEAVADSMAIYHVARIQSPTIKMLTEK